MYKTVYISGGITDVPNYPTKFRKAEELIIKYGLNVVNPCRCNDILPPCAKHEDYMAISIAALSLCDSIYMLEGWVDSKGANIELQYALNHGYKIYFQSETDYDDFKATIEELYEEEKDEGYKTFLHNTYNNVYLLSEDSIKDGVADEV